MLNKVFTNSLANTTYNRRYLWKKTSETIILCLVFYVPLEILPEMNNWISLQFDRCLYTMDDVNKEWIVNNSKGSLEYMQSMSISLSNRIKIVNFTSYQVKVI